MALSTLDLEPGEFRHPTPKEVNQLRKSLDTPFKPKPIKELQAQGRASWNASPAPIQPVSSRAVAENPSAEAQRRSARSTALPLRREKAPPVPDTVQPPQHAGNSQPVKIGARAAASPVPVVQSLVKASAAMVPSRPSAPTRASPQASSVVKPLAGFQGSS